MSKIIQSTEGKAGRLTLTSALAKNDCAHGQCSTSSRETVCVKEANRRSSKKKQDCSGDSARGIHRRPSVSDAAKQRLENELKMLQVKVGIGSEVTVEWQPGAADYGADGKKLAEIVRGNTIFIFLSNLEDAAKLVRHGFLEWILNQHTRPYLRLINQLISLHEEEHYERKEKIIDALLKLL